MVITFNINCWNNTVHPITVDISDWDNWTIIDSPCIQQYGKLFGAMTPCAQNIKSNYYYTKISLKESIITTIVEQFELTEKTIQTFKQFTTIIGQKDYDTLESFIRQTIKRLSTFGESSIPIMQKLIQESTFYVRHTILSQIASQKNTFNFQLPREIDITTDFLNEACLKNQDSDTDKIKQLLKIIAEEQIRLAAPIIFSQIQENEPLKNEYIDTILKFEEYNIEKCMEYIQTKILNFVERALLVLEKINPPNIVEIAAPFADEAATIKKIVHRIIQNQARKQHIPTLIQILLTSESHITRVQISKILSKLHAKEITPTLLEYLQQNPQDQDKKEIIYATIIRIHLRRYETNPLQILEDFKPNIKELKIILEALLHQLSDKRKAQEKIMSALIKEIKKENFPKQDEKTYIEIIRNFG